MNAAGSDSDPRQKELTGQASAARHWGTKPLRPASSESEATLPDGVVGGAEVDEEVPGPVGHLQEVPHALQVRGQEAGTPPDGGHPPGRDTNVAVLSGELQHLPMQVIRALSPRERRRDIQWPRTRADVPLTPSVSLPV